MNDYNKIFKPGTSEEPEESLIKDALECLDNFGNEFTAENLAGMDKYLHFPHILMSGSDILIWEKPGQLPSCFFEDLKKTGWCRTVHNKREVVLVCKDKVHFRVQYTREGINGKIISEHDNLWIVTRKDGFWGIALRSY